MKKTFASLTSLIVAVGLFMGCATTANSTATLTPAQVAVIGTALTVTADTGATYAIQQDAKNAQYFVLADAAIDNFIVGTNLSSAALQAALTPVVGTNIWVGLAVNGTIIAYEVAEEQNGGTAVTNTTAVAWITAVEAGFKEALASSGTGLTAKRATMPYFITNGKVDKDAIVARIRATKHHSLYPF